MTDDQTPEHVWYPPDPEPPAAPPPMIDAPGVYYNVDKIRYHLDPVENGSLCRSEAMDLLPPNCPQIYKWKRDHREPPNRAMDFGTAAHSLVLETGPEIRVIDEDDYRTKRAKQQRDEAREQGLIPLLSHEYEIVAAMEAALRAHPYARFLLDPGLGVIPEVTLVWWDPATGVARRAMLDGLPPEPHGEGRLLIPDYKSCRKADRESVSRAAYQFGYHMQHAWYCDGAKAVGLAGDREPVMVLIMQEKDPPFLVNVVELDPMAVRIGRDSNDKALALYRECMESGHWPGYGEDVQRVPLPPWVENKWAEENLK